MTIYNVHINGTITVDAENIIAAKKLSYEFIRETVQEYSLTEIFTFEVIEEKEKEK